MGFYEEATAECPGGPTREVKCTGGYWWLLVTAVAVVVSEEEEGWRADGGRVRATAVRLIRNHKNAPVRMNSGQMAP